MHRREIFVLFAAVVTVSACSTSPKVSSEAAPGVSFAGYKTFSFVTEAPRGANPVAVEQIQQDVGSAMAGKGYTHGQPGDLTVVTSVGAQNRTQVNTWGWWGQNVDVYQYTEGQLAVDVYDTKTKQALWHGQATEKINPGQPDPAKINEAVAEVMASFPATG
jgi:hypothetical protein